MTYHNGLQMSAYLEAFQVIFGKRRPGYRPVYLPRKELSGQRALSKRKRCGRIGLLGIAGLRDRRAGYVINIHRWISGNSGSDRFDSRKYGRSYSWIFLQLVLQLVLKIDPEYTR